jgi:hypothetical protein
VPAVRHSDSIGPSGRGPAPDDVLVPELSGGPSVTTIAVEVMPESGGWTCRVRLADETGTSEHLVRVNRGDLQRFAPGATTPDDLVRRSFEFLLEREPRQSILSTFDLPVIGRYFPQYEAAIRR